MEGGLKMADRKLLTPGSYLKLVRRFPLRPIRSEEGLDQAIVVLNTLLDRDQLDPAEEDYLDVLGDLVERYEQKAHVIEDVDDAVMLEFLIDQKGVKQVEVSRATGIAESSLSEVLRGKRQLNRGQISKLARYFHVEPGVFLHA
jgi:HTH-type transcriptional regulator/antitoxin HigA